MRSFRLNFNQWAGWNFDGDRRSSGGNVNAHWTFTNNWSFGSGFNVNAQGFDDRLTRGGPGGYVPGNVNQWGYLNTDNASVASASTFFNWFHDRRRIVGLGRRVRDHPCGPSSAIGLDSASISAAI